MQDIQHLLDRHHQDMESLERQRHHVASDRARRLQELELQLDAALAQQEDKHHQEHVTA